MRGSLAGALKQPDTCMWVPLHACPALFQCLVAMATSAQQRSIKPLAVLCTPVQMPLCWQLCRTWLWCE